MATNKDFIVKNGLQVGGDATVAGNLTVDGSVNFSSSNTAGTFTFGDGDKLQFGDSQDLQIYHSGAESVILDNGTGNLDIRADSLSFLNAAGTEYYARFYKDGSANLYNNGSLRLTATGTGVDITGNMTFGDSDKAIFGAGSDLQIYHNGTHSYIADAGTGDLKIYGEQVELGNLSGVKMLRGISAGEVYLYYNNAIKLTTAATGVDITGGFTATTTGTVPTLYGGSGATNTFTLQSTSGNSNHSKILIGNVVGSDNGGLSFYSAGTSVSTQRMRIFGTSGDIAFYDAAGTTTKFYWDASSESLGIGTNNPGYKLDVQNGSSNALARIYTSGAIAGQSYQTGLGHYRWSTQNASHILYNEGQGHTVISANSSGDVSIPNGKLTVEDSINTNQVRHSIRPTLNLDFANSKQLDSRITFYRNSIATYYDSKGILRYANANEPRFDHDPVTGESKGLLIEEARENIETHTTFFGQWSGTYGELFYNTAIAPDGTYSAVTYTATTGTLVQGVQRTSFTSNGSSTYTATMHFKKEDSANGVQVAFFFRSSIGSGTNYANVTFNTHGGFISASGGPSDLGSHTFEDIGNWWKVSITAPDIPAGSMRYIIRLSDQPVGTKVTFWGPQLEAGSFPTSYVPSDTRFTSRSSVATYYDETGILRTAPANSPRYGYSSPYATEHWALVSTLKTKIRSSEPERSLKETGLILENAASNLENYSYNMDQSNHGYYSSSGASFAVTNEVAAPDGSYTASKFVFGAANDRIDDSHGAHNQGTYTFSMWVKGVAGEVVGMALLNELGGNVEPYILLTGEWQRVSITKVFDSQGTSIRTHGVIIRGAPGAVAYSTGDDGGTGTLGTWANYAYVWGMQVESGFTSTSYISTKDVVATRSADVASSTAYTRADDIIYLDNLQSSDWYNQNESTYYIDLDNRGLNDNDVVVLGQSGYPWILYKYNEASWKTYNGDNSIVYTANNVTPFKFAVSFGDTSGSSAQNGSMIIADDSNLVQGAAIANMNRLLIGYGSSFAFNGTIKKIAYYPERLSNAQLQALTENN